MAKQRAGLQGREPLLVARRQDLDDLDAAAQHDVAAQPRIAIFEDRGERRELDDAQVVREHLQLVSGEG